MGTNQHIQKYLVRFNKLSQLTEWNNQALRKVFYDGLPERIQIKLRDLPGGKPTELSVLKVSAQTIDVSHWEWQNEQELCRRRNLAPTTPKTPDSGGKPSADNSSPKHGDSKKKKGGGGNGGNSGGSPTKTSTPASEKPHAKVLGPDGKLLPAGLPKICVCYVEEKDIRVLMVLRGRQPYVPPLLLQPLLLHPLPLPLLPNRETE
jgi:hypothetical protein